MTKGKVKWYNDVKGFGFIQTENGKEIFVHRTALDSPFSGLQNDEEVIFETRKGDRGLVAVNVKSAN